MLKHMIKIVESIYIEASPEKICDYLINPSNLPKYWPNIAKITDIKELPNEGYSTRWFYRMGPLQFTGTGETVDCARGQYIVDHIKGGGQQRPEMDAKSQGYWHNGGLRS